ncbi:hypothetical protein DPMN_005230 [Dreissena polymorpha]|uniref:Uncharacterized protein n=1 Tax=Dreissena polymorpha TaxID=45954 RepID=A0A9D4FRS5_DREPO|nr:hypothetical protein DPMN_131610 [Dreissena polymorpha]KAH3881305.1 hypothetical protein DPMN_005230 [Dreissena polymorpha]
MVEPTIWPALEGGKGRNREKSVRPDGPTVEPTIWPALEEIRQKQAQECKTRRTYGRTNQLACLGGREGRNR